MGFIICREILKSDLVLDVGSGNYPHPRANVICDKCIDNDTERGGEYLPKIETQIRFLKNRIFIVAEAESLPFKDKIFDYTICSHVIEHSEYPDLVLKELVRVSSRGYIETPSIISEILFGWDYHKWYIILERNTLMFKRKKVSNDLGGLLSIFLRNPYFKLFYMQNKDLFNIRYHWNKSINYKIIEQNDNLDLDSYKRSHLNSFLKESLKNSPANKPFNFMKNLLEIIFNCLKDNIKYNIFNLVHFREIKNKKPNLETILACPVCKKDIALNQGVICINCKLKYPVKNEIIYMRRSDGEGYE